MTVSTTLSPPETTRPPEPGPAQLAVVTTLLQLERRARHAAAVEELGFLMVNDTRGLVRYRQAALWRGRVAALSGAALIEANAPYVLWLNRLLRWAQETHGREAPTALSAADVPAEIGRDWAEWLPARALWLPLGPGGEEALCLAREEPWTEAERQLLAHLADAYGHALRALDGRRGARRTRARGRVVLVGTALLALAGVLALPMPQTVLAPAEVIARAPSLVRAPIDGVVDRFDLQPNAPVAEGQLLLALDRTRLQNRLEVARKALNVAEAEFRQASQQAVFDSRSKANLAVLKGRMEQQAAEMAYVEELLSRVEIRAPRAGIAVFDDVNDWIGKPVTLGERILTVADPQSSELEIRLPVADAIALERGAEVKLFLNVDPQRPVAAHVTFIGYQAETTPDGVLSYRLKARFDGEGAPPRIGLKGVAKLYGEDGTLLFALLRRPLAAARQRLGL